MNGEKVLVMRDPGCTVNVVSEYLVKPGQMTGEKLQVRLINGYVMDTQVAKIKVKSAYCSGKIKACVMKSPVFPLIIGNTVQDSLSPACSNLTLAVVTRQQAKREQSERATRKLAIDDIGEILNDPKLVKLQTEDETLKKLFEYAQSGTVKGKGRHHSTFKVQDGILYRLVGKLEQLVVPKVYRTLVFKLAHSAPLAGHQGKSRTLSRIQKHFFWPGMVAEVNRWTASCDICQRTSDKGRVRPAPMVPLPVIGEPFARCAIDLVGPIIPASAGGYRYILVLTDFATKWPEAVPLKSISTEAVADALLGIFTRLGVPKEVLSDKGSQFTGNLMKEVFRLMSIKGLHTTPYHPQTNGACERLNGTLKKMLKKVSAEQPHLWHRYINPLLFAYREVEHKSTGYSPFYLVYGRQVRGPLHILKETLEGKGPQDAEQKTTYQYVLEMRERLAQTYALAQEELRKAGVTSSKYYNRRASLRNLEPKDKCLILLPTASNKLLAKWQGPFEIKSKINRVNYVVDINGVQKVFHINMLKKYLSEPQNIVSNCRLVGDRKSFHRCSSLKESPSLPSIAEKEELLAMVAAIHNNPMTACAVLKDDEPGKLLVLEDGMDYSQVEVAATLEPWQQARLKGICERFSTIFTDKPPPAQVQPYEIKLTERTPVRSKPYPIPFHLKDKVEAEIADMETQGYLEPSTSPYASPLVVVKKPDGKPRVCGDYRKLNKCIEFDAEPMANTAEIFARLSKSRIFSKIDLAKGFYQLPLAPESRKYTALVTPLGLKQFTVVPFGLSISPAAFNRSIRHILQGIQNVEIFVDDVLVHTHSWKEHISTLEKVFSRLKENRVSVKPSKCQLGTKGLEFLGHYIGNGQQQPKETNVNKIQDFQRPTTKKGVRSFLGLCGYYAEFIPNYTYLAQPLIRLTGKAMPREIQWTAELEAAFTRMKAALGSSPILQLPDMSRPFILQTDASEGGIGAALLQEEGTTRLPVAFWSRKLKPAEQRYSTIERECLAIVEACKKFIQYLYGAPFILESDHQPLSYLHSQTSKVKNIRLTKWALYLQDYSFKIRYIRGADNVLADSLSRQWTPEPQKTSNQH